MAILGSGRAYTLLDSVYQETSYLHYPEKIAEFKTEFSNKLQKDWAQNLYWNWFYCLMPLLYAKGTGYPFFMQTLAWSDKELMTALASWAELRHDTILYAKQSYPPMLATAAPPGPVSKPVVGYVEPVPQFYARLVALTRMSIDGLGDMDVLDETAMYRLEALGRILSRLLAISEKELANR